MSEPQQQPWLELDDSQLTSEALVARVEERLEQRRAQLGPLSRRFPTFQTETSTLDTAATALHDAALREALRQLHELPPPSTHAALASSPATRLPFLGRLWTLIRSQAHQLVLFYVNRHLAHQAQANHLLSNVLHEMSARLIAQQQELERLRARLEERETTGEQSDG